MKLRDLKPGDKFTITSTPTLTAGKSTPFGVEVSGMSGGGHCNLLSGSIEVTRVDPEPAVGQVYVCNSGEYQIIALDGDDWWMKNTQNKINSTWLKRHREFAELTYVSG